mmetsp:Transcript_13860/g.34226  ORF Transcript_13860/g.34226 Transcript_13860/m.34226 type:complete len:726 (+) Transcript_13860:361-2538(+)|eukprot:CAMPEP_0178993152 /NCGR_PEP_ID=MMETSP0795-20121207/6537_1 /TAXON_ID=88552 /ORGANISM="Amoebophrya sp., Strain Ameob2" /LENGTH=725 /DNA_ID=CAMNT_0020685165 /DNA_START=361 /DNA_END=2538 /DNA_ORIENTATION=+
MGTTQCMVRPDGVAVITLDNPPVNSLASGLVKSFNENLQKVAKDPKVKAVVVTGKGALFCGGFAIEEFATSGPQAVMNLHNMINGLDGCGKTTVAAINGQALGGGGEVALACHYRVAADSAQIGFPEVLLGLLPGGQGTQRLPRVAPFDVALSMIMTGQTVNMMKAGKAGIVDKVEAKGSNLIDAAAEFALSKPPRPISKMKVPIGNKVMAQAGGLDMARLGASKSARGMIAPDAIVECFRAACLGESFEAGVAVEMEQFGKLVMSPESASLRNIFFAERAALKVKGNTAKPISIKKVGIIGAGLMGGGIAMNFLKKGIQVVIKDAKKEWLDAGVGTIKKNYDITVSKGKMKPEKAKQMMSLLTPTLDYKDLKDVDIIIEAVPEIMPLKKEVFRELGKVCRKDCLVCTNTSGLDIDEIAAAYPHPEKVMGTHFFSPANVMQLLENVRTKKADAVTLASCMHMGKIIGKKAVLVGNCDGFVGNRMMGPYGAEARMMVEQGADLNLVDKAAYNFGMPMGPLTLADLVGLELFWKQRKAAGNMQMETKVSIGPYEMCDWLCEQDRYGVKTGRGIFLYDAKTRKKLKLDPELSPKVAEIQKQKGMVPRKFDEKEVCERLFFPLVNEGFKILEEGMAQRPTDIDVVYVFGYGFPPYKGGPMHWADNIVGLEAILAGLKKYGKERTEIVGKNKNYRQVSYWEPSKLLEECVAKGVTLAQCWKEKEKAAAKL